MSKIPESPSYTKPVGKPGDERKHPHGEKVDYTKYETEHPFKNQGYKGVGSNAKTGKAGEERVRPTKVDYTKFDRTGTHENEGYGKVGSKSVQKGDGKEREYKNKRTSPFRGA